MNKILIIKMSALGDVLIAMPHVERIIEHHKDDQIWVLTGPSFAEFFIHHPRLHVAVLDRRDKIFGNSTWSRIRWLRKQQFDCIYDLQGNRTSRLLVRYSGSPLKIGTQPRAVYTHSPQQEYTRETRYNVFDRLNETLAAAGLPPAKTKCSIRLTEKDKDVVEQWKRKTGLDKDNYALFHAGSSAEWPSKRWPAMHFSKLAGMIEKQGIRCVWVGGRDEKDLNFQLAAHAGIDATGRFTPLQLYCLGQSAQFAVTNDSGPMHIFCAAGIPVYSFFGPTDWQRSHGAGQAKRVFNTDAPCSPCFSGICTSPAGHICMDNILPDAVFQTIINEMAAGTISAGADE